MTVGTELISNLEFDLPDGGGLIALSEPIEVSLSAKRKKVGFTNALSLFIERRKSRKEKKWIFATHPSDITLESSLSVEVPLCNTSEHVKNKSPIKGLLALGRAAEKSFQACDSERPAGKTRSKVSKKLQSLLSHPPRIQQESVVTYYGNDNVEIALDERKVFENPHRKPFRFCRLNGGTGGKCLKAVALKLSSLKRIMGHEYGKASEILSSLVRRNERDINEEAKTLTAYEDCPICCDPMTELDMNHPIQCTSPYCKFNFCVHCIESLIRSSMDEYMEASDGSQQVKVFLQCPNCRCNVARSIKTTLLLRTADMDLDDSLHDSLLCHIINDDCEINFEDKKPPAPSKESMREAVESAIITARQSEDEFLKTKPSFSPTFGQTYNEKRTSPRQHRRHLSEPIPGSSKMQFSHTIEDPGDDNVSEEDHNEWNNGQVSLNRSMTYNSVYDSSIVNSTLCSLLESQLTCGSVLTAQRRIQN
jgi:hypothetical protein